MDTRLSQQNQTHRLRAIQEQESSQQLKKSNSNREHFGTCNQTNYVRFR